MRRTSVSQTESPTYAPASASILFPGFQFAAERRDFPRPTRKTSRPPAVKLRLPLVRAECSLDINLPQSGIARALRTARPARNDPYHHSDLWLLGRI